MQTKLVCLSLAACLIASCEKSESKAKPDEASSQKPRTENRTDQGKSAENPAPARRDAPGSSSNASQSKAPVTRQPLNPEIIRPADIAQDDSSWETLTAEQMIEKFQANGIARVPRYISEKILGDAAKAGTPEDQVVFITQETAAWHRINEFKESEGGISDPMKLALLENLARKHGGSWKDMIPELDEQVAASVKVDEMRSRGIPGMSPEESQDFFIEALGKFGPDYKTILSLANQRATK